MPLEAGRRRNDKSKNGGLYGVGGIVPGKYYHFTSAVGYKTFTKK